MHPKTGRKIFVYRILFFFIPILLFAADSRLYNNGENTVVKKEPGTEHPGITKLKYGEAVYFSGIHSTVISSATVQGEKTRADWLQIRTATGITGWVFSPYLSNKPVLHNRRAVFFIINENEINENTKQRYDELHAELKQFGIQVKIVSPKENNAVIGNQNHPFEIIDFSEYRIQGKVFLLYDNGKTLIVKADEEVNRTTRSFFKLPD